MIYWTGWNTVNHLLIALLIGFVVYGYRLSKITAAQRHAEISQNWWLIPYIIGIGVISYIGSFGTGKNILGFGADFFVIACFSLIIFICAIRSVKPEANKEAITMINAGL